MAFVEQLESRQLLALSPVGAELLVNTVAHGVQVASAESTATAMSSTGAGVIVFSGRGAGDEDGVFARRINADGTLSGSDFRVNVTTSGVQQAGTVAMRASGEFVVAWSGRGAGDVEGIFIRRYAADGTALGGEILVNSTAGGAQGQPAIAVGADGQFVVAWSGVGTGDFDGVFMRRFAADGTAQGAEVRVNTTLTNEQAFPAVAIAADGSSIVAWSSRQQDGSDWGVYAQRFNASGVAQGTEFQVNTTTAGSQVNPAVGFDSSGNATIVWSSNTGSASGWDVVGRRFGPTGQALGAEFVIHANVAGTQKDPQISVAADGRFVVSYTSGLLDGAGWEIYGREFDAQAQAVGSESLLASASGAASGYQEHASIALSGTTARVVWSGRGATDRQGVYVRQLQTGGSSTTNTPPVLAAIGNKTVDELTLLSFTAQATDTDVPANTLTYTLENAPSGATINPTTGVFTWTPSEAQGPGSYTVTIRVTDNGTPQQNDFETITITVNEVNVAPVLAAIGNKTVDELTLLTFTAQATDADLPAGTLTYTLESAPAGAAIDPTTGVFTWTPTEAQGPGSYNVTIRVTDNGTPAQNDFETITISVNEVNQAPVLAAIGNKVVDEQTLLTFTAQATDADLPAGTLIYTLENAPAGAVIDASTGVFTWTPTEAQGPGSYNVTVRVTDTGSPAQNDFETITITVNEVNLPPNLTLPEDFLVTAGQAATFTATATDPDLPAGTLTYFLDQDSAPAGATIDPTTGVFSWTPPVGQAPGAYTITVLVTDSGTPAMSDSEQIIITVVAPVNTAPVLAPIGNKSIDEQTLLTFTAQATDNDVPANTLTFSLENAPSGATIDPATGVFTWTPTEAQGPGSYDVTVRVTDSGTPALSDSEQITITVGEVNLPPNLTLPEDFVMMAGQSAAFTAQATDDDLPAGSLTYFLDPDDVATGATVDPTTGVFNWTPSETLAAGQYTFTILVIDNGTPALSDSEQITITISANVPA